MATSIAQTRPTAPEPSAASQAHQARRSISLDAVSEPAALAVREGLLHCAIVAVGDASGLLGLKVIPGPEHPAMAGDSLFFLASVTKPIVATATMQLVDEGRLDLHAPIQHVLPEFRGEHKDRVTAWHVLTHTSGVPDMDIDILRRKRPDAQWLFENVCRTPLSFEPGSRYSYGSDSFYLLAALLNRLTGMPFPEALRRRVLLPVGAHDVSFDPRYARRRIMTVHGVPLRNRIVRELTLRFVARATLPGGGLWGTAEDLIRFGVALLPIETGAGPRILSQAAIDEMTREQTTGVREISSDGTTREPHYALGWGKPDPAGTSQSAVGTAPTDPRVRVPASPSTFTHGGATGTRLWVDPERGLVFVFLTNAWGAPDAPMFSTLAELYRAWDAAA